MYFELEASAVVDPADYIWFQYISDTRKEYRGKHNRHNPVFEKGVVYGIRQTRSKVPSFQIRLLHESNIPYRNFTQQDIKVLEKHSNPYKDKIEIDIKEGRQRAPKKAVKPVRKANRLTDNIFAPKNVDESVKINFENYQWRKITVGVKVHARKSGKYIATLNPNDIIGVRFYKPSLGAFILLDSVERKNISTADFESIVESSTIQPSSLQRTGEIQTKTAEEIAVADKAKEKARNTRKESQAPKEKVFVQPTHYNVEDIDLDKLEDNDITEPVVRSIKRQVDKIDKFSWDDDEDTEGTDISEAGEKEELSEAGGAYEEDSDFDKAFVELDEEEDISEGVNAPKNEDEFGAYENGMEPDDKAKMVEMGTVFKLKNDEYTIIDIRKNKENGRVHEYYFIKGGEDLSEDRVDIKELYVLWLDSNAKLAEVVDSGLVPTDSLLDMEIVEAFTDYIFENGDSVEIKDLVL